MRFRSGTVAALVALGVLVAGCSSSSSTATSAPPASVSSSPVSSAPVSSAAVSAVPAGSSTASAASSAPASSAPAPSAPDSSAPGTDASSVASSAVPQSPTSPPSSSADSAAAPRRIVSLSPTATEDLFAIGAGAQVVAVDSDSNYPATVPKTNLSAYEPNVEAIAKYRPDLVVISDDINNIKAQLTKLAIPVLVEPAAVSLDDAYAQITALGKATGHTGEAGKTVAGMRDGVAALVAKVPARNKPLTYFHELDNTLFTVSSKTFVGQIYALAGLEDVADAANGKGTAYPQLSAEYLVKSDPDLIFLADTKCCQQNAATFGARPGFSALSAVKDKHVIPLDDDIASRWGPRIVQFLGSIVDAAKSVRSS